MQLKLILRRDDGSTANVAVTADATASVSDLARALVDGDPRTQRTTPTDDDLTLRLEHFASQAPTHGRVLDGHASLIDAGVRSGATVAVCPGVASLPRRGRREVAVLRVLSGADAGRDFPLPLGTSAIGRSTVAADVVLTDPGISNLHAYVTVGESIEIVDNNSTSGVGMGGHRVARTLVGAADVVYLGDTAIAIAHTQRSGAARSDRSATEFNRSPRVIRRFDERIVQAPEPPKRPEPGRIPMLSILAPALLGLVLLAVTRNALTLLFVALSPVLMLAMYVDTRMADKRRFERDVDRFSASLRATATDLTTAQNIERAVRQAETPSLAEARDAIFRLGELLWTHRPEHSGFLTVRLGLGMAQSRCRIEMPTRNDTEPRYWGQLVDLQTTFSVIADVPIVGDLRSAGALGICGPRGLVDGVARGVLLQLVGLHSPAELSVAAFASPASRGSWEWLEWLPHCGSVYSPLTGDHLADTDTAAVALLAALEGLVSQRIADVGEQQRPTWSALSVPQDGRPDLEKPAPRLPAVVVLVEDDAPVDRARLTRLAELGPAASVHVLWVAPQRGNLPAACRSFLLVESEHDGSTAGSARLGRLDFPVSSETITIDAARQLALLLAPIVDVGAAVEDETDLPRSVSYLALAGHDIAADPATVVARWRESNSILDRDGGPRRMLREDNTLRALVGSAGAAPFQLDLREQGPHALVGGTTGAGKSEFLQAWVLGMATAHSPDRVTFLFVDYKGGSAFAECLDLPHTVGLVTDLSPHLVRRALISLRAELKEREKLLNAKRAKDLLTLERSGDPDTPPALVIVVDEFAALAKEVPEFVDGVVDIAARGRSLGLHLVLATQRPAGVVSDNLRANTNLRIALRMADEPDSIDIVGRTVAAHFSGDVPGRGIAKAGPGRLTTFQSGYTGGWTRGHDEHAPIDVSEMSFGHGRMWRAPVVADGAEAAGPTDIVRIVATVGAAAHVAGVPAPRKPWLPELADVYDQRAVDDSPQDTHLLIGVSDDPDHQAQVPAHFRPDDDGNMAIFGTGGAGKSTVLRTLAVAASLAPEPVEIYGLDFGSGGLHLLAGLPNVGAVIDGDDEERVGRLLRRLRGEIDVRKQRYTAVGADRIGDYRMRAGAAAEPRVLLLVDGVGPFRDAYEHSTHSPWFAVFTQIASGGRPFGIHVAVTADRPNAVPTSLASLIQRRLVLRLASADDYAMAGVRADILAADSPPGRGILDGLEVQVAVLGGTPNVAQQSGEFDRLAEELVARGVPVATPIARLPERVALDDLPSGAAGEVVIGMSARDLAPVGVRASGLFMVTGPPSSGRTVALRTIAHALRRQDSARMLVLLSPGRSEFAAEGIWNGKATCPSEAATLASDLTARVADGRQAPGSLAVIIESLADFADTEAESDLTLLVKTCAAEEMFVVGESAVSSWSQAYNLGGPFKAARRGLVLMPTDTDPDLLSTPLGRIRPGDFAPGRGFLVEKGKAVKLQTALLGR